MPETEHLNRRRFLKMLGLGAVAGAMSGCVDAGKSAPPGGLKCDNRDKTLRAGPMSWKPRIAAGLLVSVFPPSARASAAEWPVVMNPRDSGLSWRCEEEAPAIDEGEEARLCGGLWTKFLSFL